MSTETDKNWQQRKLRKMVFYAVCGEERERVAKIRRVSGTGKVYILVKRRANNE